MYKHRKSVDKAIRFDITRDLVKNIQMRFSINGDAFIFNLSTCQASDLLLMSKAL